MKLLANWSSPRQNTKGVRQGGIEEQGETDYTEDSRVEHYMYKRMGRIMMSCLISLEWITSYITMRKARKLQVKYVMLIPSSKLKGDKNWQKYETGPRQNTKGVQQGGIEEQG